MIDYEREIFDKIHPFVAPLCAKNSFKSVHTPTPTAFPAVALFELSNTTDTARQSTSVAEDYAILIFQAHVYAKSKNQCRNVFSALDNAMRQIGFLRFSGDFTPNAGNVTVYEFVARYRAEIDQNGIIYRRR